MESNTENQTPVASKLRLLGGNIPQTDGQTESTVLYYTDILRSKSKYIDLVELGCVNVTPKRHCIFHHVPEFCGKYGGLGRHSEQASESVHADFKKKLVR